MDFLKETPLGGTGAFAAIGRNLLAYTMGRFAMYWLGSSFLIAAMQPLLLKGCNGIIKVQFAFLPEDTFAFPAVRPTLVIPTWVTFPVQRGSSQCPG